MCTVTFYPLSETDFVLSSSRDESPLRGTIAPQVYEYDGLKVIYPKDELAGGTWIGVNKNQRALTLMNGGFENHKRKPSYRMSRGIIVLDLLTTKNLSSYLAAFDGEGIEPFTIVLFERLPQPKLLQIVWDEERLHVDELPLKPRIWSSTPLYTREMHALREKWYATFLKENTSIGIEALWHFHNTAGEGDKSTDLRMDRGFIHTKSLTQISLLSDRVEVNYQDFEIDKDVKSTIFKD